MLKLDSFGTRDGYGDYLWDRVLWLLAPGAIVFLVGFAFLLKYLTPVPLGGGHAQTGVNAPAPSTDHETPSPSHEAGEGHHDHADHAH